MAVIDSPRRSPTPFRSIASGRRYDGRAGHGSLPVTTRTPTTSRPLNFAVAPSVDTIRRLAQTTSSPHRQPRSNENDDQDGWLGQQSLPSQPTKIEALRRYTGTDFCGTDRQTTLDESQCCYGRYLVCTYTSLQVSLHAADAVTSSKSTIDLAVRCVGGSPSAAAPRSYEYQLAFLTDFSSIRRVPRSLRPAPCRRGSGSRR